MDPKTVAAWVAQIQVKNQINDDVEVINSSPLTMIGKGRQGAVFHITEDRCVKVFGDTEDCEREYYALSLGQKTSLLPRVYEKGANYIVLEYVTGVDLREYLQSQPLTPALSLKLIELLVTFKKIGFERIDHHKRQIYVQSDGNLKVIDVGRAVWRDRVYPYPRKLLNSLGDDHRAVFLSHVETMAPELYKEWQYYIQMEQLAHEVYQHLMMNPNVDRAEVREWSHTLLNEEHGVRLEQIKGLMYKVFKEEWARAMRQESDDPEAGVPKIEQETRPPRRLRNDRVTRFRTRNIQDEMRKREEELRRTERRLQHMELACKTKSKRLAIRQERTEVREEIFAIRRLRNRLLAIPTKSSMNRPT